MLVAHSRKNGSRYRAGGVSSWLFLAAGEQPLVTERFLRVAPLAGVANKGWFGVGNGELWGDSGGVGVADRGVNAAKWYGENAAVAKSARYLRYSGLRLEEIAFSIRQNQPSERLHNFEGLWRRL